MVKAYRCSYGGCEHPDDQEGMVKKGSKHYHSDCLKKMEMVKLIKDFYRDNCDANANWAKLQRVINVLMKDYNPDYILFALRYQKAKGWLPHYPEGIYRIVRDPVALQSWKNLQNDHTEIKPTFEIADDEGVKFTYKPPKKLDIMSVLYGDNG